MDSSFSTFELDGCNAGSGAAAKVSVLPRRGTARPVVAVFGEWNTANLGDRAIHHEVLRFFADCGWHTSSFGLGSLARIDTHRTPGTSPGKNAVQRLSPVAKRVLRGVRQRCRMPALLHSLSRVQAIAVGGGALLSDANLHFPQSLAVLADSAKLLNKPIFCLGCSAEGKWSVQGERKIRRFLAACAMVAARDDVTAERILGVLHRPIPVFGDFCLTEAGLGAEKFRKRAPDGIAVNVCRVPAPWDAAQERYERTLVAMANRFLHDATGSEPRTVRIFTTGAPDDVLPAQRVFSRLAGGRVELHVPRNLEQLRGMLQASTLVLASRLHGAVLALAENVPILGFSPAPKLKNFLSTIGLEQYSFGTGDRGDLVRCFESADYQTLFARQRNLLRQAPIWAGRAMVRRMLEAGAGAPGSPVHPDIECT